MRALTCPECGLKDSTLFTHGKREMCRLCWVHELRRLDKLALAPLIELLRDRSLCAYCGEGATEIEHVVARMHRQPTWTVPACVECNSLAGGKLFYTFVEKRDYVHSRLRKKYRALLRTHEFDRQELNEMGPGLRGLLHSALDARSIVEQRLGFELEFARLS